jgi:CubicO group peptidase (beta-lactamase class C family)
VVETARTASGVPSISIAVVVDGKIAFEKAYGSSRLEPAKPAGVGTRYAIGSISKQLTAAAVLLLAEEGRLSLDDKVSRWFPQLTRASEVTIRQLLNMTAGYQDYWPQDYVFPAMLKPIAQERLLERWARIPLDFDPGSKWAYSSTNYVIACQILEKVSGMPLFEFLQRRVFQPLGMSSVVDFDAGPLGADDAIGYLRNALGPLRAAPKEGRGWLYAAGALAMTAHDLALWNIAVIDQKILKLQSYREMQSGGVLTNGVPFRYGLGVWLRPLADGGRQLGHNGQVSGFASAMRLRPERRVAVAVLTNAWPGSGDVESQVADRIVDMVSERVDPGKEKEEQLARHVLKQLQEGHVDRLLFTTNGNSYFSDQVLVDFHSSLRDLGQPTSLEETEHSLRGGMSFRSYRVAFSKRTVVLTMRTLPDGLIEQFQIEGAD